MRICSKKCTSEARLDGKTAIVTGANTGIGKETVKDFYKRGARIIIACRNVEKGNAAAEEIKQQCADLTNLGEIQVSKLDLSSLDSVRNFAESVLESESRIDLLVNNAGVMICPEGKTEDGFEMQFGTNHLGHFLLTMLLLPKICQSTPARIVTVSSKAYTSGNMDFDDLNWNKRRYDPIKAYGQSKLANILFTKELATRLEVANIKGVTTYCLHPGVVSTEITRHADSSLFKGSQWFWDNLVHPFLKTPEQGAQTTIYCSVDEKCANETGLYYVDCEVASVSADAKNVQDAERLWNESLKLVGLDVNYDPFKEVRKLDQ